MTHGVGNTASEAEACSAGTLASSQGSDQDRVTIVRYTTLNNAFSEGDDYVFYVL
ncbi:MAG TPA: hypothetical protein VL995_06315 [Cellvibrio sp.]|nr:hypothetical protein [Cellvibrio sp.]